MCREQWALTVIKLLRFFVLIFAVFLPDYIYIYIFCTTVAQSSKFHQNCGSFLSRHPIKPERSLWDQQNDHIPRKRFCSRGVAWTWPAKSRTNRSHRKRSYSISNIGNMMGCDHLSCVPVGPFACKWTDYLDISTNGHFEYFPTTTVRHFEFQLLIFDHVTIIFILVLTCCCIPNFIEIGSHVRPPDAHNCRMFNPPLVGSGRCHGNRIMADM